MHCLLSGRQTIKRGTRNANATCLAERLMAWLLIGFWDSSLRAVPLQRHSFQEVTSSYVACVAFLITMTLILGQLVLKRFVKGQITQTNQLNQRNKCALTYASHTVPPRDTHTHTHRRFHHSDTVCLCLILARARVCVCDWFTSYAVVNGQCQRPYCCVSCEFSATVTCLSGTLLSSDDWLPVNNSHINNQQRAGLHLHRALQFPL